MFDRFIISANPIRRVAIAAELPALLSSPSSIAINRSQTVSLTNSLRQHQSFVAIISTNPASKQLLLMMTNAVDNSIASIYCLAGCAFWPDMLFALYGFHQSGT